VSDRVWLLRHGDTEWTESERHTGVRDIPLDDDGRAQARRAGRLLAGIQVDRVLTSPQLRATETCRLAGFGGRGVACEDLAEWDYGEYEGLTDEQTEERAPGWDLFRDGAPGGESPEQVVARIRRVLELVEDIRGPCLLVGHGKVLRGLAAMWIGGGIELGAALPLDPAAISLLERERVGPLLRLWNYTGGLPPAPSQPRRPS
jgi:probable phosphoglycerate mutase